MSERIGPTNNVCYICRKPLVQPKRGRMRLTCSNPCRQARYRRLRLDQRKWIDKQIEKQNQWRRDLPFEEKIFDKGQYKAVFELSHGRKVYECMACGDQFIVDARRSGGGKRTFCTDRCAEITRERWKEFNQALKQHGMDDLVMRRFEVGRLSPLCAHCGKPFGPNRDVEGKRLPGRPRKYCSEGCGKAAYELRYRKAHGGNARTHRMFPCAECGEMFDRTDFQGQRLLRFCREKCADAFKWRAYAARRKMKAAGRTAFKWGSTGRRAAILGALKNRQKRFDRNESRMDFSGGVEVGGSSEGGVSVEMGGRGAKKPMFTGEG